MLFAISKRTRAWQLFSVVVLVATLHHAAPRALADPPASAPAAAADEKADGAKEAQEEAAADAADPTKLLAAGDRLAEEKKYEEALVQYKNAYEKIVPTVRNLPFKQPVQPRFMTRSELKEYMAKELENEVSDEEMKLMDRSLKVLGLVPSELNIEELLINLYTEEVGGFYNPRSKEMFLILEDPVKRTFLTRWLKGPEFSSEEQRTTLSHEMTHALADQHFDLLGLDKATHGNDDMAMAVSSLVEGEATLVMMSEMLGEDIPAELLVRLEPGRLDTAFQFMNMTTSIFGGRTLRAAPSIFRRTLIFPYHKGIVFVLNLTNRGGWDSINKAFNDPPISTEQILHPEKYWDERDVPMGINVPKLTEQLGETWTSLGGNSLGELQLAILLENLSAADSAAAGWDGDRYEVYENKSGQIGLAWYTTWDSADDAAEFARAISRYYAELRQKAEAPEGSEATAANEALDGELNSAFKDADADQGTWTKTFAKDQVRVEWRGSDVVVVAGFSEAENERIAPALWGSLKSPLQLVRQVGEQQ